MKTFPVLNATATGARIRELRNKNKLTVEQVRDFLGLESVQAIYKWQRGESLPSIDNLYALSTLFETSVDSILIGSREEDERSSSFFELRVYMKLRLYLIEFLYQRKWEGYR